jgi:hypothetical protein
VAVDQVGFFRPRLKDCPTKHYASQAGKALPAIPFGVRTAVGSVSDQMVPVLRDIMRAPDNAALLVADPHSPCSWGKCLGFFVAQMQAAKVER